MRIMGVMDKWGQAAFNTLKQSDIDLCDRSMPLCKS